MTKSPIQFLLEGVACMQTEGRPCDDAVVSMEYFKELAESICAATSFFEADIGAISSPTHTPIPPARRDHIYLGFVCGVRLWLKYVINAAPIPGGLHVGVTASYPTPAKPLVFVEESK